MVEEGYIYIASMEDNGTKDLNVGLFICMTDNGRYAKLKTCVGKNFALGNDKYPYTLMAALVLLRDFKGVVGANQNKSDNNNNNSQQGVMLTMVIHNTRNKPMTERESASSVA